MAAKRHRRTSPQRRHGSYEYLASVRDIGALDLRIAPQQLRSSAPILFRFSSHRFARRIFALKRVGRGAGAIRGAEPLRHDALEAMTQVWWNTVSPSASRCSLIAVTAYGGAASGTAAACELDRLLAYVVTVHLDHVEDIEHLSRFTCE